MLRKLVLSSCLLLAMAFGAQAQLRFGAGLGFTSSKSSLNDFNTSSLSLYQAGLAVQLNLFNGWAVQTGLNYQVKGLSVEETKDSSWEAVTKAFDAKYGYLEVPLQLQWGLDLILLRPYLLAEGFLGYAIKTDAGSYRGEDVTHYDDGTFKSRFEYGLAFGAGIELWKLQLSAKYFFNLGGLDKNSPVPSSESRSTNNFKGLAITAVWFF